MKKIILTSLGVSLIALAVGCMDGPFYQIKRINPYYLATWNKDRQHGPIYEDRMRELRQLERRVGKMDALEQEEWANRLEQIVREDASPELRANAAQIIAQIDSPATDRALNIASTDDIEKVRLMACKAWETRGGESAKDMLMSMAQADESNSVRQQAVLALASFNEPEVLRTMGTLLEDKSPAIQFNAIQSLADMTGQEYGGDIDAWKQYLDSQVPSGAESGTLLIEGGIGGSPVTTASGDETEGGEIFPPLPPLPK